MKLRFNNHIISLITALAIASIAIGCRSTQQPQGQTQGSVSGLRSESDARVELRTLTASYGNWQRLRVPVTVSLKSPKNITISGTAVFDRDKSIFISLKFFGFEVANIYATTDSVMVVDKYNKQYACEKTDRFMGDFPITVANVQDLLSGRVFAIGSTQASVADFKESEFDITSTDSWSLIPRSNLKGIDYGFMFQPADILKGVIIKSGDHQPVPITYPQPVTTSFGPMAPEINVTYSTAKATIDASLVWSFDKARWDKDVELRQPTINAKYRRITTDEITKMLSKF